MAITVTHSKVSTIPDGDDSSLIRPSDWNDDHVLTGTIPVENGGTGAFTANGALTNLLPSQAGNSGKVLSTDGTNTTWTAAGGTGTVTSVAATAGTGISVSGSPITTSGTLTITNTAPDQTVAIASGTGISATGTYPNFTVTNTLPDQTVVLTGAGSTTVTGTYPNFTISSTSGSGDVVGPASATDNAIARFDTTTGKLIQNSVVTIDDAGNIIGNDSLQFSGTVPATQPIGTLWYDGTTETLNFQQNNITQQIGEELFVYGKASSAITDSPLQIIYQTGAVGASGVVTFAPTIAGITDGNRIIGVATENIALNATGRVTCFGVVHGITTNGTAYGETWADGDEIWYNPVTGNPTNVKPSAPNIKVSVGTIINAGSGGSGSIQVEINHGSVLGGTDSNVQLSTPTAAQILTYDATDAYWKNTSLASGTGISTTTNANGTLTVNNTGVTSAVAGTGISVSGATGAVTVTNTAPDQTVSIASGTGISATGTYPNFTVTNTAPDQTVVLNNGTGISVTGTYPNFTVTNTAPSSGGTVTSVATGTGLTGGPITSTGTISLANTAVSAGSYTNASLTVDAQGRLTAASSGTAPVTSVTGTAPISSSGGATPAISISQATTSTNGYLSSTDWNTFNNKGSGTVTSVSGTGTVNGLTLSGTVTSSGSLTLSGSVTGVANTAKAWAQAAGGTSSPLTINGSFNVSSITRTATGKYVVNFSNALANANYSVVASSSITQSQGIFAVPFYTAAGTISAPTTSSFPILYLGTNGAPFDVDYVNFAVFD